MANVKVGDIVMFTPNGTDHQVALVTAVYAVKIDLVTWSNIYMGFEHGVIQDDTGTTPKTWKARA